MDTLLTYTLNFAYTFSSLSVIVLGLAITFGLLGVMNMAHGEFIALGAYSALLIQQADLPYWLAIPLSMLLCGITGWLMERVVIRHLYHRPFDTLLATWGIAILMRETFKAVFGREYKSIDPVMPGTVDFFGVSYPTYRLLLMAIITLVFIALYVWYRYSNTGARIKAMVQNPNLAAAVGINTERLYSMTFTSGAVIAGLAGVMIAPLVRVEPLMGFDYLLSSFFILVVGGLGSIEGLLTGAIVIGGSDTVLSSFFDNTVGYFGVLFISILFLWIRPNGLYTRL